MDRVDRGGIASDAIIFEDLEDESEISSLRERRRVEASHTRRRGVLPFSAIFRREHMQQLRPRPPWLMPPKVARSPLGSSCPENRYSA